MKSKGFTLLLSLIVMSLLLLLTYIIVNISGKNLSFALLGRESQKAFFAANSGIECALYWDLKGVPGGTAFATTTNDTHSIICAGDTRTVGGEGYDEPMTFQLDIGPECVVVDVTKTEDSGVITTEIESRGYNTGTGIDCQDNVGGKQYERAIRVRYSQ